MTSWKSASFIQMIAVAILLGTGWMNFKERSDGLEQRIARLEEDARSLAPLAQVMRGFQPGRATPQAYQASQATGPADAPQAGRDSSLAWCPAAENGGAEWLELRYDPPVIAAEIRIHANFNPGAVVRVRGGTGTAELPELWAGSGLPDAVQTIPISSLTEIGRLKLELDTSKVPGWNEIDAVVLVDAQGTAHWAQEARASSTWGTPKQGPSAPR